MLGVPAFAGGLGVYLTTTSTAVESVAFPVGVAGPFLCPGSMVLFAVIVTVDGFRDRRTPA